MLHPPRHFRFIRCREFERGGAVFDGMRINTGNDGDIGWVRGADGDSHGKFVMPAPVAGIQGFPTLVLSKT